MAPKTAQLKSILTLEAKMAHSVLFPPKQNKAKPTARYRTTEIRAVMSIFQLKTKSWVTF